MSIDKNFIPKSIDLSKLTKGSFTFKAPSNIALVKYWGKKEAEIQIPKNASISFTLDACFTQTTLEFEKKEADSNFDFEVIFEGKIEESFKPKIKKYFERVIAYLPFLTQYKFVINTRNSFPHSSGIASSASGMAALSLCLLQVEKELSNDVISDAYFIKKASFLARLGSGSASRSIEGEVVVWGKHPAIDYSSDYLGVKFPYPIHANFKNFHDTILLVDKGQKQVSSTVGHNLMHNHPFAEARFEQANTNLNKLSRILQIGDLKQFITLVESEALTLHAMMMSSNPYFILMKPNTLKIIEKIWAFRKETKANICFTLDAGANVHVLFPEKEKEIIDDFITNNLIEHCQNNQYICDRIGKGAKLIDSKL